MFAQNGYQVEKMGTKGPVILLLDEQQKAIIIPGNEFVKDEDEGTYQMQEKDFETLKKHCTNGKIRGNLDTEVEDGKIAFDFYLGSAQSQLTFDLEDRTVTLEIGKTLLKKPKKQITG